MDEQVDVVVVGGGLSGLVAARELSRRGVDVLVLEAAERLGGRALSTASALGSRLDLGGQWIGHDHHRLSALAAELGATKFAMHSPARPVVLDGARRLPALAPSMLVAYLALLGAEALSRTGTPARWNTTTVASVLRRIPSRTSRRLLGLITSTSTTADLDRLSVSVLADFIRYQGGLSTMLATKGGAQDSLLIEGIGFLVDGLAAELGPRVRTGSPVTSIVQDGDGLTVRSGTGTISAKKVVVTVPPPTSARISFTPPLPAERIALQHNTYMGSVYKAIAVYPDPFWRSHTDAEFLRLGNPGAAVFDTSPPDGPGHLCVLVAGPDARALDALDPVARRAMVLAPLADYLGAAVLEPVSWHEKSWHTDEYAGGGYIALPIAGTREGMLPMPSTPTGDIHWAGAETAGEHAGYLEGAIESGTRVATEVIEML